MGEDRPMVVFSEVNHKTSDVVSMLFIPETAITSPLFVDVQFNITSTIYIGDINDERP